MSVHVRFLSSLANWSVVVGLFLAVVCAQAQTIVFSNFGEGESYQTNTTMGINAGFSPAYGFTAASGGRLDSIKTSILWVSGTNAVTLSLYTDVGGQPGTLLESLQLSDLPGLLPQTVKPLPSFSSIQKPELIAGSSYFLFASASGTASLDWAYNNTSDTGTLFIPSPGGSPYIDKNATRGAFSVSVSAIPEPSTYAALFGAAALGLVVWRRRMKR